MTLDEQVARGQHAEHLLGDTLLTEIFAAIEADCITRWRASGAMQEAEREKIWQYLKMADGVKRAIEIVRDSGRTARIAHDNMTETLKIDPNNDASRMAAMM